MVIGNYKRGAGQRIPLNKWIFSFEFLLHPPWTDTCFKPVVFIACMKVLDHGRPGLMDDPGMKYVGFWKQWILPKGIAISIDIV